MDGRQDIHEQIEDAFDLSPLQQGMLLHTRMAPGSGVYVIQQRLRLAGAVDAGRLRAAWEALVHEHGALRTSIAWEDVDNPIQIQWTSAELPWVEQDLSGLCDAEQRERVETFAADDLRKGFDLTAAPLLRVALLRLSSHAHEMIVTIHHIVVDGWSMTVLLEELLAHYADRPRPAKARARYSDYIEWLGARPRRGASQAYWRQQLHDLEAPTPLGIDIRPRRVDDPERGYGEREILIDKELTAALRSFARASSVTPSTLVHAAWAALLSSYSGERDVVFGTTMLGRPPHVPGIEATVGLFVNTIPVRIRVDPAREIAAWLADIQRHQTQLEEHATTPLLEVQRETRVPAGQPLFESLLAFENLPMHSLRRMTSLRVDAVRDVQATSYPLTLSIYPGERMLVQATYQVARFSEDAVERLLRHFEEMIRQIARERRTHVADLYPVTEGERRALLGAHVEVGASPLARECVHTLFEAQVERTPDAVAVVADDLHLSYEELDVRANRVALDLRDAGVGPEIRVALLLERSVEMLVALIGVLKAGGAFVPIDPDDPEERRRFTLEHSGAAVVLTREWFAERERAPERRASFERPTNATRPGNLAYVIYTSGSTGRPKGVLGTHRALVVYSLVTAARYRVNAADRVLQFAALAFDGSLQEIVPTLLVGARLVLRPTGHADAGAQMWRRVNREQLTMICPPTAYFEELVASLEERVARVPGSVRFVLVGGEKASAAVYARFRAIVPDVEWVNEYGPTETTIAVTAWVSREGLEAGREVPIGSAHVGVRALVLDDAMRPAPLGAPAELFVGGDQVTRGYLGCPGLTAERFVPDPLGGGRLYRTGDRARLLGDGNLEFCGRKDNQVKVRGFRVELAEVETAVESHAAVRHAVVVFHGQTDKKLVAYVVARDRAAVSAEELRAHVARLLPEHMLPSAFVLLDALPLGPTGKVDRRSLPEPAAIGAGDYVAPRTPTEELISRLFGDVLGVEHAGAHDNFFELGGHSLLATRLLSRVSRVLDIDLAVRTVFESPTVEALARAVDDLRSGREPVALHPVTRIDRHGPERDVSYGEERLWFLWKLEPENVAYHMIGALRMTGELDVEALAAALDGVVARHEVLRTRYEQRDTRLVGVVEERARVDLPIEDLSVTDLGRTLDARAHHPFDLSVTPQLRACLYRLGAHEHVLWIGMHHIVSDGWSIAILVREIGELYEASLHGRDARLPELSVEYRDYASWQRRNLAGERLERDLGYWKSALAAVPALELRTDRPRPALSSHRGAGYRFAIAPSLTREIKNLSRDRGVTDFMTLLGAFGVLLGRYAGQYDFAVGTPIANRRDEALEPLIGFFVNTLALRLDLRGDPTFVELLCRIRETMLDAYAHQDAPFEKVVEVLDPERLMSTSPIFQVMLVIQNEPRESPRAGDLQLAPLDLERGAAQFDLSLHLIEDDAGAIRGLLEYATDLFDRETVERFASRYVMLMERLVAEPEQRIDDVDLLTDEEKRLLLVDWNATRASYPRELCLHELLEEQVERTPDAVAVVFEDEHLTYRDLALRAHRLTDRLSLLGIGPDDRVAVCAERSIEMVIALHAVLRAGAAYVPLDPEYPAARLAFMLEDASARVVLAEGRLADTVTAVASASVKVLRLETELRDDARARALRSRRRAVPSDLVYVLYTSGSTGRPKGVLVQHGGVTNRLAWMQERFALGADDVVMHKTPFTFDVSVWELFWPLLTGARLVMAAPGMHKDPAYLTSSIGREAVTTIHFVPSMLEAFVGAEGIERCRSLRHVIASGEALTPALVRRFYERGPVGAALHNLYGPTEASIDVSHWACERGARADVIPIGTPIANTQLYVVDRALRPSPIRVPGELYIGGVQLARGYGRRPALTAQTFVPDPFGGEAGARLYRTGDLARHGTDGNIEYLGRIDHQVKIRGFRIELGEIERTLEMHPSVRAAVVVVREDVTGDKRLVAYVIPRADRPSVVELRASVGQHLPDHMLPNAFVWLDELPLSPSGKIDRRALPAPDVTHTHHEGVGPRTATEQIVAEIFAEVLGIDRVGAHDDFFALGGHSLVATRLVSRLSRVLGIEVPLRLVFERPTVAALASALDEHAAQAGGPPRERIERADRSGPLPLSYGQERMWFLWKLDPESAAYHMVGGVKLRGALDVRALERAASAVVRRHEVLRTRFVDRGGQAVQIIDDELEVMLPASEASDGELERLIREQSRLPFHFERGPLIRLRLVRVADAEHVLLVVMHHVVSDGWSIAVVVRELAELYDAEVRGREPRLPELTVQYADYAAWQRRTLSGERLERELGYWKDHLAGVPVIELPTDRPRAALPSSRGAAHHFEIAPELVRRVKALSLDRGVTEFMTLLGVFGALLGRYTGQTDFAIGTAIAGRRDEALEGLVGFFVNTLALRIDLRGEPTFFELLDRIKTTTLGAYAHQDAPFEKVVEALQPERRMSTTPLFQVMLTLQNMPDAPMSLPGLEIEPIETDWSTAQFDLGLDVQERGGAFRAVLSYATDLFDRPTIERLAAHMTRLLERVLDRPDAALSELDYLLEAERRALLVDWNATETSVDLDRTLPELIEEQARHRPDAIAVRFEDEVVSYSALIDRARRLASRLCALGCEPEERVGICAEPSCEMIIAMLAVLEAGAAYVPLDPSYPRDRLAFMISDARIRCVLAQRRLRDVVDGAVATVLYLDGAEELPGAGETRGARTRSTDLAYVIYTSGSTGRPKGVMVPHSGLVNYLTWAVDAYPVRSGRGAPVTSSFSFDGTITALLVPLAAGESVEPLPPDIAADELVAHLFHQGGYGLINVTPAHLELVRPLVDPRLASRCAAAFVIGGEPLSGSMVAFWLEHAPRTQLVNEYGPTETTVACSIYLAQPHDGARAWLPIGKPVANTKLYVVDTALRPTALGVAGELYIGGAGVARGYHARAALTAERFVPDPFGPAAGARLYRSGDRARWRSDGDLDFLGRIDQQIKLRGFRIELGEIEAALARREDVQHAVVIVRDDDDGVGRRLVAYIVPAGEHVAPVAELRAALASMLPEYMIPSAFVTLEELPRSPNGKIDRKALPAPEALAREHVAPRTPIERALAEIFEAVLAVPRVGIHDSFFDLGGHSLLATQVVARVQARMHVQLPVRALFDTPEIAALARHQVFEASNAAADRLEAVRKTLGLARDADPDSIRRAVAALKKRVTPSDD